mmetsp:Transcript_30923/g.103056  ORF Transcript_30923/g.103056 Transcript_30923/m.103056 type:complete len:283 (+) Transcript_30923:196-1044(+)
MLCLDRHLSMASHREPTDALGSMRSVMRCPVSSLTCRRAVGAAASRPASKTEISELPCATAADDDDEAAAPPTTAPSATGAGEHRARAPALVMPALAPIFSAMAARTSQTRPLRTARSGNFASRRSPALRSSPGARIAVPAPVGRSRSPPSASSGSSRANSLSQALKRLPVRSTTFRATPSGCSSLMSLWAVGDVYGMKAQSATFTPSPKKVRGNADELVAKHAWLMPPTCFLTTCWPSSSNMAFNPSTREWRTLMFTVISSPASAPPPAPARAPAPPQSVA